MDPMSNSPRILIIGAGAIGCLVGGKLAQAGYAVTLAGRPRIAEIIRNNGLHLIEPSGEQIIRTLDAKGSISEAFSNPSTTFDLIVLTVKSYDTASALTEIQTALQQNRQLIPAILSLQNGVGNEEEIETVLGAPIIIAGNITTPVSIPEVGVIRVEKAKYGIGLAQWGRGRQGDRETGRQGGGEVVGKWAGVFGDAGFVVKAYPDAQGMKWTKLLLNIVGNATSAILDEAPAVAFADLAIVDLELTAWRETLQVMRAAQIPALDMDGYPLRLAAPLVRFLPNLLLRPIFRKLVAGGRGNKMPSLHIDLHGGKGKSEIGWLNGAVAAKGKRSGVATPVNQLLTETLLAMISETGSETVSKNERMNSKLKIGHAALLTQLANRMQE